MGKKYQDKEWLKEKTEEGLWQGEIGEICGVSSTTIGNWQRKYNIEPNHRKKNHKQFVEEVQNEVGDEYIVLGKYTKSSNKIKMGHNKCGKVWKITPAKFLTGRRCPRCRKKEQIDRMTKSPKQFKGEVKDIYGEEYTILDEYKNAKTKILVRHNKCGFEYKTIPHIFIRDNKKWGECPVCNSGSNSIDTEVFKYKVRNLIGDEYDVLGHYNGMHTSIKMKHNNCGKIYNVTPDAFLQGRRCPKCSKRKRIDKQRKTQEKFDKEVRDLVGKKYTVLGDYKNANTKILIRHNEGCGHEYKVKPTSFLQGNRCPKCKMSKGENRIDRLLDRLNIPYQREKRFEECQDKMKLPFDFGIENDKGDIVALISFDGKQHYKPNGFFGDNNDWKMQVLRDHIKDQFAFNNDIPLLRTNYMDRDNGTLIAKVKEFLIKHNILN